MREHAALFGMWRMAGKICLTGRPESRIIETGGMSTGTAKPAAKMKEERGNAADTITD